MAPVRAGLVLGLIWGVWHLPAFYLSGLVQSEWSFMPFLIGSVAVSLILTAMFNAARGSILLAALFHFQLNNPLWPDGRPWDMYLFAAVAAAVVWIDRKRMFSRAGAATDVIFPEATNRCGRSRRVASIQAGYPSAGAAGRCCEPVSRALFLPSG